MIGMKLFAVLLLSASVLVSVVENACPDEENIAPCTCMEESGETILRCLNIPGVSELEKVAQNSDGYKYEQVHIEASTLQYIPKVVPETIRTNYLGLRNLTLNRIVDSIPNSLEELTNVVLQEIKVLNTVSWEVFSNTSGLQSLIVDQIEIPVIKSEFNNYISHNLKTLYIQYAGIKEIEKGALQDFDKLQTLSLINNELKSLQRDSFPTTCNIELLFLINNKLTDIPDGFFTGMEKLNGVFLTGNLISRLNEPAFGVLQSKIVDLSDNPIKCDCYLKWIGNRSIKNIQGACASPKSLAGKSLQELTADDFDC